MPDKKLTSKELFEQKRKLRKDKYQNQKEDNVPEEKNKTVERKKPHKAYKGIVPTLQELFGNIIADKNMRNIIAIIATAIVLTIAIAVIFNKNAVDVFLDEVKMATLDKKEFSKDKDGTELMNLVKTNLETENSAEISTDQKIVLKSVRLAKKKLESKDYLMSKLKESLVYTIKASSISVAGIEIAVLKNTETANQVLQEIKDQYSSADAESAVSTFVEEVSVTDKWTSKDMLETAEVALEKLKKSSEEQSTYIVQSGDIAGTIISRHNMDLATLISLNPGLDPDRLQPGDQIKIVDNKAILNVKTIEVTKKTESIPIPEADIVPDSTLSAGETVIRQYGQEGEEEVSLEISYLNGVEIDRLETRTVTKEVVREVIAKGSN